VTRLTLPRGGVPAPPACPPDFTLVPQAPSHVDADYEAVMSCRRHLRAWSMSEWPEDDFTLEQNREDLAGHIDDARQGLAYGYTVFAPDGKTVWGSLYLNPIEWFRAHYLLDEQADTAFAQGLVEVDYWMLPDREEDVAFHRLFIETVQAWLVDDWGFERPLSGSRQPMEARRRFLAQIGWQEVLKLPSLDPPARHMWFHAPT